MKKIVKLLIVVLAFILLIRYVKADESLLSKIEKGGTVDVNIVDPVNLTKTLNTFKERRLQKLYEDEENPPDEWQLEALDRYYSPVGTLEEVLASYISASIKDKNINVYVYDCDSEYNCQVSITELGDIGSYGDENIYNVRFNPVGKFNSDIEDEMIELYTNIQTLMDNKPQATNSVGGYKFVLEDINMIDYLYNMSNYNLSKVFLLSNAINYVEEIRNINKKNYTFFSTLDAGDAFPSLSGFGGRLMFGDKDSIYYAMELGGLLSYRNIIYIDESTEDTLTAYMEAAKKRVQEYYGKSIINIEYKDTIRNIWINDICSMYDVNDEEEAGYYNGCATEEADTVLAEEYGQFNMLPYMYKVTINKKTYDFLIAKDNSKLAFPSGLNTIDYSTDFAIESTSNDIPLDSKIELNIFDDESNEYLSVVNGRDDYDFYQIFDIKLFSNNANKYITKLNNGSFKVKIPLKDEYKGKALKAYFFKPDGTREKYDIHFEGNYIYFITNHFSVYSIATRENDDKEAETPIITLEVKDSKIALDWDDQDAVVKYIVYRSTDGKKYTKLSNIVESNYTDKSIVYGKKYYYKVKACDVDKCSDYSNVVNKKVVPNKVNLNIKSASTNYIKLEWDKVSVTGYEVYMGTKTSNMKKIKTITKNSTLTYKKSSLSSNKKYYFKVRAYKTVSGKKVYGSFSDIVSTKTAPVKPKFTLSARDYNALNVNISKVSGATKYVVEKSLDGKTYTLVEELPGEGKLAQDDLETGKTYYYRVRACNTDNRCSGWVTANKKVVPLSPKLTLSTSSKTITITLTSVNGVDGYKLYRSTRKSGKYTLIKEFTTEDELLEYVDSTKKGTTYYYKVRSYKVVNEVKVYSSYSSIKNIKSK